MYNTTEFADALEPCRDCGFEEYVTYLDSNGRCNDCAADAADAAA